MSNENYSSYIHSLSHTKWNCKYHIVFAPKYRRKVFFEEKKIGGGSNIERIMQLERSAHNSSRSVPRPCAYVCGNTTENEYIKFYGISKRKEQYDDIRKVWKFKAEISK